MATLAGVASQRVCTRAQVPDYHPPITLPLLFEKRKERWKNLGSEILCFLEERNMSLVVTSSCFMQSRSTRVDWCFWLLMFSLLLMVHGSLVFLCSWLVLVSSSASLVVGFRQSTCQPVGVHGIVPLFLALACGSRWY